VAFALAPEEDGAITHAQEMLRASRTMDQAVSVVARYRSSLEPAMDTGIDPNKTGLIGREADDLMTSLGNLDAKRTTTNPNFAALIVHLLCRAGVTAGDRIAIGSSGSFPALLIASLAAAKALEVHPVAIISLGASSFGATNTDFNLLRLYQLLLNEGVFAVPSVAVTLGGEKDVGLSFDPDLKERLIRQISDSGIPFIQEADLRTNVLKRMAIYGKVAAFINIGGAYANLGTSQLVLNLKPGLNDKLAQPPENERGVIFEMAQRGVPVIHLLFIKGLAARYGLPWDPVPLPGPGEWSLRESAAPAGFRFWAVTAAYFALLILLALSHRGGAEIAEKKHSNWSSASSASLR
jgi:poly-gamma-glutamate system protein